MKKTLLIACLFCFLSAIQAQNQETEYRRFRVDLGFAPIVTYSGYGAAAAIEPNYTIEKAVRLGYRMEASIRNRGAYVQTSYGEVYQEIVPYGLFSLMFTSDYYFIYSDHRFFAGAGFGKFIGTGHYNPKNEELSLEELNQYGAMFRLGWETRWHLRLALEYNLLGLDQYKYRQDYLALKLSTFIGGGRKKAKEIKTEKTFRFF